MVSGIGSEPIHELAVVTQFRIVCVVAVEKRNAHDFTRNFLQRIHISKDQAAAAAMTGQDKLSWKLVRWTELFDPGEDRGNGEVTICFAPRGPAFLCAL